jgi:kynurenine formamidase
MDLPDPPLYRRAPLHHEVRHDPASTSQDDLLLTWNPQSSSQWDGFRHVRRAGHGFFGGIADADHGVGHWGARGIAARAVLVDVARWRASVGRPLIHDTPDPIDPDDLLAALRAQGSTVLPGDVLLVRTGFLAWYRTLDRETQVAIADPDRLRSPGLRPVEASARLLWDLGLAAVAADNPALEVWPIGALLDPAEVAAIRAQPEREPEMQLHTRVLTMLGMPIGELWDLDPLADRCAADGRYSCLLASAPLRLPGGVASPANAIVIR